MCKYEFKIFRLGECEYYTISAPSEKYAWKYLVSQLDTTNVDKIFIVSVS